MEHHNYSFFGQKSAVILDSASFTDPFIYLRFLKKLPDGRWEKPSQGEGKNLKLNLLEITEILYVLNHPNSHWSTVHKFEDQQTSIKVESRPDSFHFFITGYAKPLGRAEMRVLNDLLEHIYREKIAYATNNGNNGGKITNHSYIPAKSSQYEKVSSPTIDPKTWIDSLTKDGDYCLVPGKVTSRREKALSYALTDKSTIWVPLSQIKESCKDQDLWIREWFLDAKLSEIFQSG